MAASIRAVTLAGVLRSTIRSSDPHLAEVVDWIPFLPLSFRKVLLTVCQSGLSSGDRRISDPIRTLFMKSPLYNSADELLRHNHFLSFIDYVHDNTFRRSFISMLLRCEAYTGDQDDSDEVLRSGAEKEVLASQNVFSEVQVLDYSSLYSERKRKWDPEYPLTPAWVRTCRIYVRNLTRRLVALRGMVLFPDVQRKKNVSRETADRLWNAGYRNEKVDTWENFRTVDLEVHYHRTGQQVGGNVEMRWAWKYNDLKPRIYYCVGGDPYWSSRYIKQIAVDFMETFPVTEAIKRRFPDLISSYLSADETIVTWDYESFTTTMSELKWFLYWTARCLEEDPQIRSTPLRLFDYYQGIVECNIWDMLDAYNTEVNVHSRFSIHRICDLVIGSPEVLTMHNSGPLGVSGNIGFSTTLHGLHTAVGVDDSRKGVCVGDDAMGLLLESPFTRFIPHIRRLGRIHPDKFECLHPIRDDVEVQRWKFLKRGLVRKDFGFYLEKLFDFPILAPIFAVGSKNRTIQNYSLEDLRYRFVSQVSALFWDMYQTESLFGEEDIDLLMRLMETCYRKLGLYIDGSFPGARLSDGMTLKISVPCVKGFNPCLEDWSEVLWDRRPAQFMLLPIENQSVVHPEPFIHVGQEFIATETRFSGVLEDLEIIERGHKEMQWVDTKAENHRLFRLAVRGLFRGLFHFVYICEPPAWYQDVLSHLDSSTVPTVVDYSTAIYGSTVRSIADLF